MDGETVSAEANMKPAPAPIEGFNVDDVVETVLSCTAAMPRSDQNPTERLQSSARTAPDHRNSHERFAAVSGWRPSYSRD